MPQAINQETVLEYETFGDPNNPTLLLVMGLGAQMTAWHADFCRQLAAANLHVVRFDNRDCGLSSKTPGDAPDVMALYAAASTGLPIPEVPYSLSDMAGDAVAVLDTVGVEKAHVAGASMGGMITQQMAIDHPDRVASIISIMSTTGSRDVGQAEPEAIGALLTPPPPGRDAAIARDVEVGRVISGPLFNEELALAAATASHDRSFYPVGAAFQLAAIAAGGDRTEALGSVQHRALVIHGQADPLITPSGGEATAAALPNSTMLMLEEMGHDLPVPLWDTFVTAIGEHIAG